MKKTEYDLSRYRRMAEVQARNEGGISEDLKLGAKGYSASDHEVQQRSNVHPLHAHNAAFQKAMATNLSRFKENARMRGQVRRATRTKLHLPGSDESFRSLTANGITWFILVIGVPLLVAWYCIAEVADREDKLKQKEHLEATMEV